MAELQRRAGRRARSCSLAVVGLCLLVAPAQALPAGRAWTTPTVFSIGGYGTHPFPAFLPDASGKVVVALHAFGGPPPDVFGVQWSDSAWVVHWRLGEDALFMRPAVDPSGRMSLAWVGGSPTSSSLFFMSTVEGDSVQAPDTIAVVRPYSIEYAAAASSRRRWATIIDNTKLRLFYSEVGRPWVEVIGSSIGGDGVAIAALDDTTALVVWANRFTGLSWGTLRGSEWMEDPTELVPHIAFRPTLRRRPSGGYWLAWSAGGDYVGIRTYRDGVWSAPESLGCAYRDRYSVIYYTDSPSLSNDAEEYPAAAWGAYNSSGAEPICVTVPSEFGFSQGEQLDVPDGINPSIERDLNGDAWVAWWDYSSTAYWMHSYTKATCPPPHILGSRARPVVTWTLSEPAPGSWWLVQRAHGDGGFEAAGRVRAGADLAMSYTDTTAPHGKRLRYRIRRECVDVRYRWLSEESEWHSRGHVFAIKPKSAGPLGATAELTVEGAESGPLELRLYDIQGRVVLRREVAWTSGPFSALSLDLGEGRGRLASGIYFLRATDAAGQAAAAIRFVILR